MERLLIWGAAAVGGLVFLLLNVTPRRTSANTQAPRGRFGLGSLGQLGVLGGLLPIVLFVLSLPTDKPFSVGSGLGFGLLIGGLAALIAFVVPRLREDSAPFDRASSAMAVVPVAVAIPLLFFRATLADTLAGIALGWAATAILLALSQRDEEFPGTDTAAGAIFAALICGLASLATYREGADPMIARGLLSGLGVAVAALLAAALIPAADRLLTPTARTLFFLPIAAAATGLVAWVAGIEPAISLAVGVIAALLSAPFLRALGVGSGNVAPLTLLLGASALLAGTQLAQGLGLGLAALGFAIGLLSTGSRAPAPSVDTTEADAVSRNLTLPNLVALAGFAVLQVAYRWLSVRWGNDLRVVGLSDQYALFGVIVGAFLPGVLASVAARRDLFAVAMTGLVALAAPCTLVVLFGAKCVFGLLIGLTIACGLSLIRTDAESRRDISVATLFAVAIGLVPLQILPKLLPFAEATRADRMQLLIWTAVIAAILTVIYALSGRLRSGEAVVGTEETR